MKTTPAPWVCEPKTTRIIGDGLVIEVYGKRKQADCRLISYTPRLLEVTHRLLDLIRKTPYRLSSVAMEAREVVAEAEGR